MIVKNAEVATIIRRKREKKIIIEYRQFARDTLSGISNQQSWFMLVIIK